MANIILDDIHEISQHQRREVSILPRKQRLAQEEGGWKMDRIGRVCFVIGVIASIIAGFSSWSYIFPILTILGLIVGLLNVQAKEVQSFLLAGISLVIISGFGAGQIIDIPVVGSFMGRIYIALLSFVGPATLIVALKSLFGIAKS